MVQYKGSDLPGGYMAISPGGRVWIVYQVFADFPLLGLRNILRFPVGQ